MQWVIIGSRALKYHKLRGKASDIDIWTSEEGRVEPLTKPGTDVTFMPQEILDKFEPPSWVGNCASVNDLLTIKLSHLVYDIFWWKHVQDVLMLLKNGAKINHPLYEALCAYWKEEHEGKKSKLSLYKTKDQFFDDFVPKEYEHDYLHELVAGENAPVYSLCLAEGQEVLIDRRKFYNLPFDQQIRMFKEEVAVIALERWVIPSKGDIPICHAWNKALHKTVVSLTKGWASRFIVEHLVLFLEPLHSDMERTLTILNIKEKNTMSYEEFKEMLAQRFDEKFPDGLYERYFSIDSGEDLEFTEILLEGMEEIGVELVEQEGGEGQGENAHTVLKVDDTYYLITYNYYSHVGFELDYAEVRVVTPQKKMVTVYE